MGLHTKTIPNVSNGIKIWPGGFKTARSAFAQMDSHIKQKLFYTLAHVLHKQVENCILYSGLQFNKPPLKLSQAQIQLESCEWFIEVIFFRVKLLESDQVGHAHFYNFFFLINCIKYVLRSRSFFWIRCINMNEDSRNRQPVLLNWRTILRMYDPRTCRAE